MIKRTSFADWEDIAAMAIQKKRKETADALKASDVSFFSYISPSNQHQVENTHAR